MNIQNLLLQTCLTDPTFLGFVGSALIAALLTGFLLTKLQKPNLFVVLCGGYAAMMGTGIIAVAAAFYLNTKIQAQVLQSPDVEIKRAYIQNEILIIEFRIPEKTTVEEKEILGKKVFIPVTENPEVTMSLSEKQLHVLAQHDIKIAQDALETSTLATITTQ